MSLGRRTSYPLLRISDEVEDGSRNGSLFDTMNFMVDFVCALHTHINGGPFLSVDSFYKQDMTFFFLFSFYSFLSPNSTKMTFTGSCTEIRTSKQIAFFLFAAPLTGHMLLFFFYVSINFISTKERTGMRNSSHKQWKLTQATPLKAQTNKRITKKRTIITSKQKY